MKVLYAFLSRIVYMFYIMAGGYTVFIISIGPRMKDFIFPAVLVVLALLCSLWLKSLERKIIAKEMNKYSI